MLVTGASTLVQVAGCRFLAAIGWWYFARIAYWGALRISVGGFLGIGLALTASTVSTASTGAVGAVGAAASPLGFFSKIWMLALSRIKPVGVDSPIVPAIAPTHIGKFA